MKVKTLSGFEPHYKQKETSNPKGLRFPHIGAGNGTRTRDLRITNALLYRLSYTSITNTIYYNIKMISSQREIFFFYTKFVVFDYCTKKEYMLLYIRERLFLFK